MQILFYSFESDNVRVCLQPLSEAFDVFEWGSFQICVDYKGFELVLTQWLVEEEL